MYILQRHLGKRRLSFLERLVCLRPGQPRLLGGGGLWGIVTFKWINKDGHQTQIMVAGRVMCLPNRTTLLFIFWCLAEPLPRLFSASCLLALVWAIPAIEISCSSNPLIRVSHWDYHQGSLDYCPHRRPLAIVEPAICFFIFLWIGFAALRVHMQLWNDSRHKVLKWTEGDIYFDHIPEKMMFFYSSQPESTSVEAKRSKMSTKRKWGLSWVVMTTVFRGCLQ